DRKHLTAVLAAAAAHRGTSLVEIYQNCPIFNDGAFDAIKGPNAADHLLRLEPGLEVSADGRTWTHDPTEANPTRQFALSRLDGDPDSPVPIGIFRQVDRPTYDHQARAQVSAARALPDGGDLQALLDGGDTWTVPPTAGDPALSPTDKGAPA
ncbi:hypothetical protein RB608_07310, partial [Nocardioides sp. LHD-245]|nr:hypothetical protein [Nocardioides sp. LHD-245]